MKEFNKFIAYMTIMVVAIIIGLPAYIVGEIDLMIITTLGAFLATIIYMNYTIRREEDYEE